MNFLEVRLNPTCWISSKARENEDEEVMPVCHLTVLMKVDCVRNNLLHKSMDILTAASALIRCSDYKGYRN